MLSYFVVDRFPFITFLARPFFPHPNKTRDVVRPRRLTGVRDFIETKLGLFETARILSRASDVWPCDHRSNSRNEIASLHSSPQLQVRYATTLVAECLKRIAGARNGKPSCLGSVTRRWPATHLYSGLRGT